MAGFRATASGVTARFARPEAVIVRDLVEQVVELVDLDPPASNASKPSKPSKDSDASTASDADELAALVGMADLEGGPAPERPDDPVLARLLPDGYRDDPEAAMEFRRFTEPGLRSAKVAAAQTVLETLPAAGGRIKLSGEQAEAWLRSLNDVRLALGVRLGVTDDFDGLNEDIAADDPRSAYFTVYQWLAYLQESLLSALS